MPKFYFTYGTDPSYPFQGGWTEVEAPDRPSACTAFKMYHPDASPLHPNCAGICALLLLAGCRRKGVFGGTVTDCRPTLVPAIISGGKRRGVHE